MLSGVIEAGNPAVSLETRSFPTPPRDGCGFISFPVPTGKQVMYKNYPFCKSNCKKYTQICQYFSLNKTTYYIVTLKGSNIYSDIYISVY
ncbi:hypothetical protein H206_02448 [Candidatus Electrothrix aarhusensis]|jgi:hypothetical protein|uniref:Uncharacterized protein n=1 Tax=Candidatus Electrothrix aarhusensis TaxID=1859131 RepID=A0A3S3QGD0_9BACT|nr:hypothetical protein H206_02448 [Candidatus Electrothrix aarhusensis]